MHACVTADVDLLGPMIFACLCFVFLDDEEDEREAICRATSEVLDDLRGEYDDPAGNRNVIFI
jgi:hypothetical protein